MTRRTVFLRARMPLELSSDRGPSRAMKAVFLLAATGLTVGAILASAWPLAVARGAGRSNALDDPASQAELVVNVQRALRDLDRRLAALGSAALDDPARRGGTVDERDRMRIELIRAEGDHEAAVLKRESAEIAVRELEAVLSLELVGIEAELATAQSDKARAREALRVAKTDSQIAQAQLEERRVVFAFDVAESKKRVLLEHSKDHRRKDVQTQLMQARTEERRRQQELELVKRRLAALERSAPVEPPEAYVRKRLISLVERGLAAEQRVQAALARVRKAPSLDPVASKETLAMLDELSAILDEAEALDATDEVRRLRARFSKGASPVPPIR